jgi:hypothetical protein
MDAENIRGLIAELEADIEVKTGALQSLRRLLSLNGSAMGRVTIDVAAPVEPILFRSDGSYVDLAVKVIEGNAGRPLRVKTIVEGIRTLKGNPNIERRSIEATLHRHIAMKKENSRVVKVARGIYGIRRFTREHPAA